MKMGVVAVVCWTLLAVIMADATSSSSRISPSERTEDGFEDHRFANNRRHNRRRHSSKVQKKFLTGGFDDSKMFSSLLDRLLEKPNRGRRQLADPNRGINRVEIDPAFLSAHMLGDPNNVGGFRSRQNWQSSMNWRSTDATAYGQFSRFNGNNPSSNGNNGNLNKNSQQNQIGSSNYDNWADRYSNLNLQQRSSGMAADDPINDRSFANSQSRGFNSTNTGNLNLLGGGNSSGLQSPFLANGQSKTISLSGKPVFDGNATENRKILSLLTTELLGGFALKKIKQFNDRTYLSKFRRNYWFGERYYRLDHDNFFENRDTCVYQMDAFERQGIEYEDGPLIDTIVFQCQRYVEVCCGLTCCFDPYRHSFGASSSLIDSSAMPCLLLAISSLVLAYFH